MTTGLKLLLDTHALLWWWTDDAQLPASARQDIANPDNQIWVSAASAWEIATKQRIGKLPGVPDASTHFMTLVSADGFTLLPISAMHALRAGSYPAEHRDPFDRMLAAQAELERLTLLSLDPALAQFGIATRW